MAGTAPITLPAGTFHVSNVTEGLMQKGMKSDDLGYLYRRSLDLRYCEAKYGGIFSAPSPSSRLFLRSDR